MSAPSTASRIHLISSSQWDERLLPFDPLSVAHVLKNSTVYEKPWQSRRVIAGLVGRGMLAVEGHTHKRQRRVATPAFSIQNLRELMPLVFRKGDELQERWSELVDEQPTSDEGVEIDVFRWISRATFDVIGLAGEIFSRLVAHDKVTGRQGSIITLTPSTTKRTSSFALTRICLSSFWRTTVQFECYLRYISPSSTCCS